MKIEGIVDHLFRHQYGKMVSTLVRLFGFSHLEIIEDAVQDTFIKAMQYWRNELPDNPEGWLTQAAKNRAIDLLRKIKNEGNRLEQIETNISIDSIEEVFLEHQIEDNQLRMIFTACHPQLNPKDQIAFALKTISGFSDKEIATALLLKHETVKKRLTRARKTIQNKGISFSIPHKRDMGKRIGLVHEVLYLIFNEGFHSIKTDAIVRKELCGEAIRLASLLLKKEHLRTGEGYALFGLFCFHAARLDSKLSDHETLLDLKNQDRTKWHIPLIQLGNDAMNQSMKYNVISTFHIEAAIAAEHLNAPSFEATNWEKILGYHKMLHEKNPSDYSIMNIAVVLLQLHQLEESFSLLQQIHPNKLEKRSYLYYGIIAEYYILKGNKKEAIKNLDIALEKVSNLFEKKYLEQKKDVINNTF